MFRSLKKDPELASYDEWLKAGDFALEMRFFPHAFNCFQLASSITKDDLVLRRLNDVLDKITNVLEFVPSGIKSQVEEIRLSNPLDPSKWLAMVNSLLKNNLDEIIRETRNHEYIDSLKFTLALAAYCAARSGADIQPINDVLKDFLVDEISLSDHKLDLRSYINKEIKVVILGDSISLGLEPDWSINFQETYHYLWSKESQLNISLAANAIAGAGVLDLALYLGRDAIYYKPDIAILMFGNTDIWLGESIVFAYEALLEICTKILHQHNIQVIIISPIPYIHLLNQKFSNEKPPSIDNLVKASWRAASKTGAVFVNAFEKFSQSNHQMAKFFIDGSNQPNTDGQKLIKIALEEMIIQ